MTFQSELGGTKCARVKVRVTGGSYFTEKQNIRHGSSLSEQIVTGGKPHMIGSNFKMLSQLSIRSVNTELFEIMIKY